MKFNRFDICSAYYLFGQDFHTGMWSKEFNYMSRAKRAGFNPSFSFDYNSLTENGRAIYNKLVKSVHKPGSDWWVKEVNAG